MNNIYKEALPYVYRVEHKATGRYYFGYRCGNKRPASADLGVYYFTSCKHINRNNWHEYTAEVLSIYNDADTAWQTEQNLIWACWDDPLLLNKACHRPDGKHWKVNKHSEETKAKMREAAKRAHARPEVKVKRKLSNQRPEVHARRSKGLKQRDYSCMKKVWEQMRGKPAWNRGIPWSAELRDKILKARKSARKAKCSN